MKIIKLQGENIKRLHAIEITPDGALVTIGGKNGAGKSSVLDSIAYAMGGEKLAAQAEAADMQVWMEYVSESKDGVAVMMVDGEVM